MTEFKESQEPEIDSIFEGARQKLASIDENAKELKKNIVANLAKKLEGKIATETICIEIVTQLQGQASERFIRECLDEKYKQKNRVESAKKQKKHKDESKLAAETPLNNKKEEEPENREVITVDTDNRTSSLKIDEDDDSDSLLQQRIYMNAEEIILMKMADIVFVEKRPFCYGDFLFFEYNGEEYKFKHGTIRNIFSNLHKKGDIEKDYRSGPTFYTLPGIKFGKPMTVNHTVGTAHTIADDAHGYTHLSP